MLIGCSKEFSDAKIDSTYRREKGSKQKQKVGSKLVANVWTNPACKKYATNEVRFQIRNSVLLLESDVPSKWKLETHQIRDLNFRVLLQNVLHFSIFSRN